jgi:ABC-type polysaccharide/polyol phosphate export permease
MSLINRVIGPIVAHFPENQRLQLIWKIAQLDFRRRYYHDHLGVLWSLLEPLFRIGIYYFVFKIVFNFESMQNYALFIFSGLLFWGVFSSESTKGKKVILRKKYLIENIQFNKLDLFWSQVLSNFMSFSMTFFVYTLVAYAVGIRYNNSLLVLPVLLMNIYLIALGTGMILSVANIFIRDIDHLWDIIRLFLFWTSGVFLRGEKFLEIFPGFLYLNPFVGIFINIRSIVYAPSHVDWSLMAFCFSYGCILFLFGFYLFKKYSYLIIERA